MRNLKSLRAVLSLSLIGVAGFSSIATSPPWSAFEDCGNGIDDDGDWLVDAEDDECLLPPFNYCGDGYTDTSQEVCDDYNTDSGDGCRRDCRGLEVCGDGLVDPSRGESCDDGEASDDACSSDCVTITQTSLTSEDLNGQNPSAAKYVVFGAGAIATIPQGPPDSQVLLVIASSDPDLCNTIQSAAFVDANGDSTSGLEAFLARLSSGAIAETTSLIFAQNLSSAAPFSAPGVLEGDGQRVGVDAGFVVGDGASLLVDTTFGGSFAGTLSLLSMTPTSISGQYDGVQSFELVSGTLVNAPFRAIFTGDYCQAVSDGLQATFGQ